MVLYCTYRQLWCIFKLHFNSVLSHYKPAVCCPHEWQYRPNNSAPLVAIAWNNFCSSQVYFSCPLRDSPPFFLPKLFSCVRFWDVVEEPEPLEVVQGGSSPIHRSFLSSFMLEHFDSWCYGCFQSLVPEQGLEKAKVQRHSELWLGPQKIPRCSAAKGERTWIDNLREHLKTLEVLVSPSNWKQQSPDCMYFLRGQHFIFLSIGFSVLLYIIYFFLCL